MAAKAERDLLGGLVDRADGRRFLRLGAWLVLAAAAVGSTGVAARSDQGAQRLALLLGREERAPSPASATAHLPLGSSGGAPTVTVDLDSRVLSDTVRRLLGERDRLLSRLEALEDAVQVTGSVAPKPADTSTHARVASALPVAVLAEPKRPPSEAPAVATAVVAHSQELSSEPKAKRLEYAVDLGADASVEGLRALWASIKAQQGALLDDLRPVVAARQNGRGGETELRLLAGPLGNTLMAGRICAVLSASGRACQTAAFEGQRLVAR